MGGHRRSMGAMAEVWHRSRRCPCVQFGHQFVAGEVDELRERVPGARLELEDAQEDAHAELLVADSRQSSPVGLEAPATWLSRISRTV